MLEGYQLNLWDDDALSECENAKELVGRWLCIALNEAENMENDIFRWYELRGRLPLVPEDSEGKVMRKLGREMRRLGFEKIPLSKRSPTRSRQSGPDFFWVKPKRLCSCKDRNILQTYFEELFHGMLNSIFNRWDSAE